MITRADQPHKPAQHQNRQPGYEADMYSKPQDEDPAYRGNEKLKDKVAIITGGDSGIGKAVAIAYAKEGANIALIYLDEHEDAEHTAARIKELNRECLLIPGNIQDEAFCHVAIQKVLAKFGKINILVNNAAEQHPTNDLLNITSDQLESTFRTNIFAMFYLTKAVLEHLHTGDAIINSTSVTAYRGSKHLMDYASTKGAIVSFTRSLASALIEKQIRVNGVAPGPVWTPLIPASFSAEEVAKFGTQSPMQRPAEPYEIAPCYVFLAAKDSSYMTGQVLHPNGGEIINT